MLTKLSVSWGYYKDFIVDLSMVNSAEEYKKVTYVNAFGEVDFL